jgi:hypothetical protein
MTEMSQISLFEREYRVKLIAKRKSWTMRLLNSFVPGLDVCFTTYRWPWQLWPRIAYPERVEPLVIADNSKILTHELVHVAQFRPVHGLWLQLSCLFAEGRWRVEREAYLVDIRLGAETTSTAVYRLLRHYQIHELDGQPAERVMRSWFVSRI